jgi:hypothetical protein
MIPSWLQKRSLAFASSEPLVSADRADTDKAATAPTAAAERKKSRRCIVLSVVLGVRITLRKNTPSF